MFWRQLEILGTTMSNQEEFRAVMAKIVAGELEPVVDEVFPLDQAAAAHQRLENGEAFGSIVLTPGG
jgi:NADPH:quinone reductase-like Zn-dependent oxidoreductase